MTKIATALMLTGIASLLVWSVACEPRGVVRTFTFVNGTPRTVTVYMDGRRQFDLAPEQNLRTSVFVRAKYLFEAKDESDTLLFRLETTEEQLATESWRIEIRDQTIIKTPTPG